MHCGQMLVAPSPAAGYPTAPGVATAAPRNRTAIILAVAIVGLLALLGGLFATGTLRFGAQQPAQTALKATGDQGPSTLPSAGDQTPPSLGVTGQSQPNLQATNEKRVMPDDVRRWLEHLERIEKRRMDMSALQVGKAMEMLVALQAGGTLPMLEGLLEEGMTGEAPETPGPIKDTINTAEDIRGAWRQLNADFNSFPPPAECVPIRNEYDVALRETGAMIGDVLSAVERAGEARDQALASLMKMRGTSKHIDAAAVQSDDLVQRICDKYETRKWFKISADVGGGSFLRGGF